MTTILSTPTAVTINTPGTSALSILARSMAPGTWAELTGVSNQWGSLCNTNPVHAGHILGYGNNAAWDPISRQIHIVGNDHGASAISHAVYNESTNTWSNRVSTPMSVGHAYDHIECQPSTGRLFFRNYNTNDYDVYTKPVGGSWTAMSGEPATNGYTAGAAVGVSYWSGSMTGIGASGCLVLSQTALGGQIVLYDPLANSWSTISNPGGTGLEGGAYHDISAYSSVKNCLIYGGDNDRSTAVWRLNSNRTVTVLTSFAPQWGILRGNCVADPVTGNFLIRTSGTGLYEYNPSGSGSYSQLTGSKAPPSNLGVSNDPGNVMSCAIPEYGVVCYITAGVNASNCHMHLYKHA